MNMLASDRKLIDGLNPVAASEEAPIKAGQIKTGFPGGARWDEIAAGFSDTMHEQSHCFNAARWGENNVENITFSQYGQIIGGASVVLMSPPLLGTGIAIVKWGPLWRKRGETPDLNKLDQILFCLKEEYAGKRGLYLTIIPPADPEYGQEITDRLTRLGFSQGTALPAPERYLVDVTLSEEELRKSLSQKWRYNLKKAGRNDLKIGFADGAEGYQKFKTLYQTMLKRKQFNDTSAIYTLNKLMQTRTDAFRPRIVLMSHEDRLTAGAVIDLSGDQAVYLYGATDDRALRLNAGYALHWFIADFLRNTARILRYDLGGNDLDGGLHQFKKGFVGKRGIISKTPPCYHFGAVLKARAFGQTVFKLRDWKQALNRKLNSQGPPAGS